jgi:hypothetical protein
VVGERVDVFVCGSNAVEPPLPSSDVIAHAAAGRSLDSFSAAELSELLDRADGDAVAFVNARIAGACADIAAAAERLGPDTAAVLLYADAEAARDWRRYPPRLAAAVCTPSVHAAVLVRRSVLSERGGLIDVHDPLWEWVIRGLRDGLPVEILNSKATPPHGELHTPPRLVGVEAGPRERWLLDAIRSAGLDGLVGEVRSQPDAVAVRAGLLQINGFLDASHTEAQGVEHQGRHANADYWHAIHHRREPDYGNANYWFRHVGDHPIHAELGRAADEVITRLAGREAAALQKRLGTPNAWNPSAFVGFCQQSASEADGRLRQLAEEIQWREMRLLLEQTHRDATGA